MAIDINYNGNNIASLGKIKTAVIECAGKKMVDDLTIVVTEEGSGECSGNHIIEVDELPQVGVEGAIYSLRAFTDILAVMYIPNYGAMTNSMGVGGIIVTSEAFAAIEPEDGMICFVTDIPEIYVYAEGAWHSVLEAMGEQAQFMTGGCLGEIANINEADKTTGGYYAIVENILYQYMGGKHKQLIAKGELLYTSNNDGTCYVSGLEDHNDKEVGIPSISPSGETVTSIGNNAFQSRLFSKISIPDSVTSIGVSAFSHCLALTDIYLPNTITEISHLMFNNCCGLFNLSIPKSVRTIDNSAFQDCKRLTNIIIPEGLTSINYQSFLGCASMWQITLPSSLTNIGYNVFGDCASLTKISFSGTVEQWNAITKDSAWKGNAPATKVICTDGEVILREEVTDSPLPIEVATADEMTALLETAEVGAVYKYTGTSDAYENGALYVVEGKEVKLISFTINSETYQAEEGMSWYEWCRSTYNNGYLEFSVSYIEGAVYYGVGASERVFYKSIINPVRGDTVIKDGDEYIIVTVGNTGGGGSN